jgi:hypothetical protein
MCTRRSRPSTLNPLMIKIRPHIFLNRVPFAGARRGPWACMGGGRVSRRSVVCTRDRVAGAGYACSARPDLHTVCRSFHKISSALSAKVRGGSRSAKILIQSRRLMVNVLCRQDTVKTDQPGVHCSARWRAQQTRHSITSSARFSGRFVDVLSHIGGVRPSLP